MKVKNVQAWSKQIDDYEGGLIRKRLENLTAAHYQWVNHTTKEFEKERKRLEDMLRFGFVPQRME